jgi:SagB-type dehydrogenase family enzyme
VTAKQLLLALAIGTLCPLSAVDCAEKDQPVMKQTRLLPRPSTDGTTSLERAILLRRSVRSFGSQALTMAEVSQLLWAAQGITDSVRNLRAAPSAGARYPLSLYLVAGKVEGLEPGIYRYVPESHSLQRRAEGEQRTGLSRAALGQASILEASVVLALAADYGKIRPRYKERSVRYTDMEAGHAGQNVSLQAAAMGLGTVMVGAFDDVAVKQALGLPTGEEPLYLMPVGRPAR